MVRWFNRNLIGRRRTSIRSTSRHLRLHSLEERTVPATIVVTGTTDSTSVDGFVSIREALNSINGGGDINGDVVATDLPYGTNDKIVIPSGTFGLDSTLGALSVTKSVLLQGNGPALSIIDGNDTVRLFTIDNAAKGSISVTFVDLQLTKGFANGATAAGRGGAIFMGDESVTMNNCSVTLNKSALAGGAVNIQAGGSFILNNSTFSGNKAGTEPPVIVSVSGGAIYGEYLGAKVNTNVTISANNSVFDANKSTRRGGAVRAFWGSTVTLTNTAFTNNIVNTSIADGGALQIVGSTVTIENCTFTGNQAGTNSSVGVLAGTGGAMQFSYPSTVLIRNTTISGNAADLHGGGIALASTFGGTLTIQNSTITNNNVFGSGTALGVGGGGIQQTAGAGGEIILQSSVVSGNMASSTPFPDLSIPGTLKMQNSLAGANVNSPTLGVGTLVDLGGNIAFAQDPKLNFSLTQVGNQQFHEMNVGSPLRNTGSNPGSVAYDQRNNSISFPRQVGPGVDIGSVEMDDVTGTPYAVINLVPTITVGGATKISVSVTYRDNVGIDEPSIGLDDIYLVQPNGVSKINAVGFTATGSATAKTVTYEFPAPGGTVDGRDNGVYQVVFEQGRVTSESTDIGAAFGVFSIQAPFVVDTTVDENDGVDVGMVSLRDAINKGNALGGSAGSPIRIVFDTAPGGAFANDATITLTNGQITVGTSMNITGTGKNKLTVSGNLADRIFKIYDGALTRSTVNISDMSIVDGKRTGTVSGTGSEPAAVTDRGGAINIENETVTLTNVRLANNQAQVAGGAINIQSANSVAGNISFSVLTTVNCEFVNNKSIANNGGAVHVNNAGNTVNARNVFTAQNTLFQGNKAGLGGGAIYITNGELNVESSTLSGNEAVTSGGGVYLFGSTPSWTIRNSTISGNKAANGGALMNNASTGKIAVVNSTIAFNEATTSAGGINFQATTASLTLRNTIVSNNTAPLNPDIKLTGSTSATINVAYSLIGNTADTTYPFDSVTNVLNKAALLSPLGNNGGPTPTHMIMVNSPARNTGDPVFAPPPSTDQRGLARVSGGRIDIGATESQDPTATATFTPVTTGGGTLYTFDVVYADDVGISTISLGKGDVQISKVGGGFSVDADFVSVNNPTDGTPRTVTYSFVPPSGTWDPSDNGNYEVSVKAGEVLDVNGFSVAAGVLGTFNVNVPGTSPPPQITSVTFNNGNNQRSMVTSVKVSFSEAVTLGTGAFVLERYGKGSAGTIGVTANQVGSDVTLTFNNTGSITLDPGASLPDGQYQLTIVSDNVSGTGGKLDGNKNGTAEGSPTDDVTSKVHRLFGDGNGDGSVTAIDFAQFRSVFGLSGPSIFDFNNDNTTNATDFAQFRARFGLGGYAP